MTNVGIKYTRDQKHIVKGFYVNEIRNEKEKNIWKYLGKYNLSVICGTMHFTKLGTKSGNTAYQNWH